MKILIMGDLHLRTRTPKKRNDVDFEQTCLGKLQQVLEIAEAEGCGAIIQPGDFFDSPDPSKGLIAKTIELLRSGAYDKAVLAIHGQHDLSYHTQAAKHKSGLRILEAAGCLELLDRSGRRTFARTKLDVTDAEDKKPRFLSSGVVEIYGASFGQEPPKLEAGPKDSHRILVHHTMVGDKPLYPGQLLTGPEKYMKDNPGFDLYIVGDYHYPFTYQAGPGSPVMVNAGCLLRLTSDVRDREHLPKVVVWDTEAKTTKDILLDVVKWEDVYNLSGEDEDAPVVDVERLITMLRSKGQLGVDFRSNLEQAYKVHDTSVEVREIVEEFFVQ